MTAKVDMFLKHYDFASGAFRHSDIPELETEALLLIAENVTEDGLTRIPF